MGARKKEAGIGSLTREEWMEVQAGLLSVQTTNRTAQWKKAFSLIETILRGRNNLTPEIVEKAVRYAVSCSICKGSIDLGDDFVFRSVEGVFNHYDCFCRNSEALS